MPALGSNGEGLIVATPGISEELRDLIDRALGDTANESPGARFAR
jgi:hypothetical protein